MSSDDKGPLTRVDDAEPVQPEEYTTVRAVITSAEGERCNVCLWLADSVDERSQGLKGVTDLGAAVGMVFVFREPVENNFVMIDTVMPLSIAWFRDGVYVSETDMEPCVGVDASTCDRYGATERYTMAVEMFQGELGVVGIGPGSTIEVLVDTESLDCAPAP